MRYWWVNQNQTYRQEVGGGYLWSPKRRADNARNQYYEFMREVSPGDLIFSYCDTRIAAIGFAQSYCYESPKPEEFGSAGTNWSKTGWRVDVRFQELQRRIRPKEYIEEIRWLLPERYSPLTADGNGLQSVYLAEISEMLANALINRVGPEASLARDVAYANVARGAEMDRPEATIIEWERRVESQILGAPDIPETEKRSLVMARRGQGAFRAAVEKIESACRVTRVDRREHLVASHAKPWRDSDNAERLNGENGLLLTPTIDHLFDKGFITFEDSGRLVVSPVAHRDSMRRMGIEVDGSLNVGAFSAGQRHFLEYHRENIFRQAHRRT
jgi:hypothetical protein